MKVGDSFDMTNDFSAVANGTPGMVGRISGVWSNFYDMEGRGGKEEVTFCRSRIFSLVSSVANSVWRMVRKEELKFCRSRVFSLVSSFVNSELPNHVISSS